EPGEGRLALVQAQQIRPDELEEVDLLGIERVDPRAAQPTCDLRTTYAEHVGEARSRPEVDAKRVHLRCNCDRHAQRLAQHLLLGNTICCANRPRTMPLQAEVAELADAPDSKSGGLRAVWVRFPPSASQLVEGGRAIPGRPPV